MKFEDDGYSAKNTESLSTRREWVEIEVPRVWLCHRKSLSPHGESGLKSFKKEREALARGLSPHGESGLKSRSKSQEEGAGHVSLHTERVG